MFMKQSFIYLVAMLYIGENMYKNIEFDFDNSKCAWCDNKVAKNPWSGRPIIVMLQKVCLDCENDYNEHEQKWGH